VPLHGPATVTLATVSFAAIIAFVNRFLYVPAIAALFAVGCGSLNHPSHPAGLALRYHDGKFGFTFYLPESWRGYSVLHKQWQGQTYIPAHDTNITVTRGPVIVLRHPQWKASEPHQDITFLVYTRKQWDGERQGKFSSTYYAGGTMVEMWHSPKYVFTMSTHDGKAELKSWREVNEIVSQNVQANGPPLYPQ
jgi:hypothetical protein